MRTPAKILLAGTLAATLTWAGAATSQDFTLQPVANQQSQTADVLANGALDVVSLDSADSNSHAMGNGYSADAGSGSMALTSSQDLAANVESTNSVTVRDFAGSVNMNTSATGNSGDANSLAYGDMVANVDQHVGPYSVTATSRLFAADAEVDNPSDNVQAIGNSHGFAVVGGSSDVTVRQSHEGVTQADGGADVGYIPGTASFTAEGVSNNVSIVGVNGATQKYDITQSMTGDRTQAAYFSAIGSGQDLTTASSAIGNNISASNENNPLTIKANQNNQAYVRAQTDSSSFDFGGANASAIGFGNSLVAGANGGDLTLDVSQTTNGGVEVLSSFEGSDGFDASSNATAMGNAATGFACSSCDSRISVNNRQTNSDGVVATSSVSVGGSNRHVSNVATAVGNSATYYLSSSGD